MIEPLSRVVRSGSVNVNNPFAETRMPGCKKKLKNKISWSCALLRRSRANSDPGLTATLPLSHNTNEGHRTPDECPMLSRSRSVHTRPAVPFVQAQVSPAPGSVVSICETDFYDGTPKMWKQSQRFFCDEIVYYRQRNPQPPSLSATQFQEDTKIWLEGLARRSKLARDRSNHKTRDEQDILPGVSSQAGLSVAPLRPTPKVRPRPVEGKSDASNHDGRRMAGSSMSGDSGSEHADQQKHLHIPYLERLRRSESPSLFRASFEEEHVNSSNNQRLVSTWSSDTLSLLALESQENERNSFQPDSPLEGEENLSTCDQDN
ncbi:hypothetical protein PGTUg99_019072 [Puccinia graminis f. sp. tritici]|uniref:Uncharacterized protein n=1 Tax=Puccinia graminis f. sp. tritici TaxID=56615 RepID=A0A5B0M7W3_PUCGR|nr:hypothetical protein PGTUg99_019072 [Puccinia graminis f. sp. tritici]